VAWKSIRTNTHLQQFRQANCILSVLERCKTDDHHPRGAVRICVGYAVSKMFRAQAVHWKGQLRTAARRRGFLLRYILTHSSTACTYHTRQLWRGFIWFRIEIDATLLSCCWSLSDIAVVATARQYTQSSGILLINLRLHHVIVAGSRVMLALTG